MGGRFLEDGGLITGTVLLLLRFSSRSNLEGNPWTEVKRS